MYTPNDRCARRGMTPHMAELNRQLHDFEFKELSATEEEEVEAEDEGPLRSGGGLRLRERLTVASSSPSRLDGLELVEPAKVDTLYREDSETSAYLLRRQEQQQQQQQRSVPLDGLSFSDACKQAERGRQRRRLVALESRIHSDWEEVSSSMRELRELVADSGGLPLVVSAHRLGADGQAQDRRLRSKMWLAMLEVRDVAPAGYVQALRQCPSSSADKINNDAFRTLAADAEFRAHVTTASVVRVLNALLSAPDRTASDPPRYVQGMNTLAAPFLYVLGEGASFYGFRQFLRHECPMYARPSLPGVHACVQLVDECLAFTDPQLFSHLRSHGAVAKIYAFPAAMTLSASVGPLQQVVLLWDFLLAFGVHLNVVCIVAQLAQMRELLLTTTTPMAFLRAWPSLRAESVIRRTREIYESLPERLRQCIRLHAIDKEMAEHLAGAAQVPDPLASLKRDLPISPSGSVNEHVIGDSSGGRPRARTTVSGMFNKRMRTEEPARPSYGAKGLGLGGLRTAPAVMGTATGGGGGGKARQRGMRMAAAAMAKTIGIDWFDKSSK
ncbi:CDC16 protein [Coemansia aciculifera]|uniref:CDC16 protein n=1 Tax=Coemansia aciculifera TaxID=417176 RepID=A0ACC1M4M9_9FUNG|nr:CDC16 protein [Coemansia aciculifera]KAJ2907912.1 CDC16 protein [Coemansia aciculifera]